MKGKRNVIIKKINEVGTYGYYDEAYEPLSNEIKIEKVTQKKFYTIQKLLACLKSKN